MKKIDGFRHIIGMRYKLLPYLYSEYMKAVLRDEMMFRPLAFDYPEDRRAVKVEDQLLLGDGMMIAPVYEQNAEGRYVYLPERMKLVRFKEDGTKEEEILDEEIEKLIEERQAARKNKDFARADEIRDQLLEQGIVLKDTREGVKWSRA